MLFEHNFYKVNHHEVVDGKATFNVSIDKSHAIFKGHFPDNPITPGVVQMEIIKELFSKVTSKEMELLTMGNCKFLAILNPIETPEIDVVLNYSVLDDGTYKVAGQISADATIYLKISAVYQ